MRLSWATVFSTAKDYFFLAAGRRERATFLVRLAVACEPPRLLEGILVPAFFVPRAGVERFVASFFDAERLGARRAGRTGLLVMNGASIVSSTISAAASAAPVIARVMLPIMLLRFAMGS
jgi:hypothetical protein